MSPPRRRAGRVRLARLARPRGQANPPAENMYPYARSPFSRFPRRTAHATGYRPAFVLASLAGVAWLPLARVTVLLAVRALR